MRVPNFSFLFCLFLHFNPAINSFLCPHSTHSSTRLPLPASLKLKCFFVLGVWFQEHFHVTLAQHAWALYFFSDVEEMDDGKRLILMAWTSVKLTNGSPKLGKPLAGRGRSEAGPSPTDFHEPAFQSTWLCQATTWRWVLAPPHVPSGLSCYQPACWHRAEPQSLMNKPSQKNMKGSGRLFI